MADHFNRDWPSTRRGSLLAWGLPIRALLLAIPLTDGPKAALWIAVGQQNSPPAVRCGNRNRLLSSRRFPFAHH
jgi:hypothetical protein